MQDNIAQPLGPIIRRSAIRAAGHAVLWAARLMVVMAYFWAPAMLVAFVEWNSDPGQWSLVARAVLSVVWGAQIGLFVWYAFVSD